MEVPSEAPSTGIAAETISKKSVLQTLFSIKISIRNNLTSTELIFIFFAQCAEARTQEQTERRRKETQGGGQGQKGKSKFHFPQR